MSDSESSKLDEMTSRIKDVVASAESHVDAEGLLHRIREAVGKVGSTVDSDAIVGRFKEVAGQAEGKIDAGRLRQWVAEVDRDKLKGWYRRLALLIERTLRTMPADSPEARLLRETLLKCAPTRGAI